MDHVKVTVGKLLGWLLVGACAVINVMLLRNAIDLPTLSGAGAAQADLGLYIVLRTIGIPVVIVSLAAITVTLFVRDRSKGSAGVLRYNYGIVVMAFVNILIPLGILYWLLVVWKQ